MDVSMMETEVVHIRERTSAFCKDGMSDLEYLQVIADFLITRKDNLPECIKKALQNAFGQTSKRGKNGTVRNREQARARVKQVGKNDITVPEFLSDALPLYAREGSIFWFGGEETSQAQPRRTILGDIYAANRRKDISNSIRRAFYSIALRYVVKQILEIRGIQHFTTEIKDMCVRVVLSEGIFTESEEITRWLTTEYELGSVYESYTQKIGYGIIFYLFMLPASIYEKYLNKTEDVSFVVDHFLSQGFNVEETSNAAANSIMGYVKSRFCDHMSIFQTETLNIFRQKTPKKGSRKQLLSQPANITSQAITSQLASDVAHASQLEPNSWATCAFRVELSTVQTPIPQPRPLCPQKSPEYSYDQGSQNTNPIPMNHQRQKQPTPKQPTPTLAASQPQQNPGFNNLYLTEPESPYSLPSFNSISAIPTGSPVATEPSSIISTLLPSFSLISGIPSP